MSAEPSVKRKIYLAADALWDLRQGTLARISADFAVKVTTQSTYYTREEDLFSTDDDKLTREIFNKVFTKYRDQILRISLRTEILSFLLELCREYIKQAHVTPFMHDFGVQINMYPFTTTKEQRDEIQAGMSAALGGTIAVDVVNISWQDLSIDYACATYASMIMYNYYDWLNAHVDELKKKHLREVGLFVPRVYFTGKDKIPANVMQDIKQSGQDTFDINAALLNPFLAIQYLPVALFSAATPLNKPEYRKLVKVVTK